MESSSLAIQGVVVERLGIASVTNTFLDGKLACPTSRTLSNVIGVSARGHVLRQRKFSLPTTVLQWLGMTDATSDHVVRDPKFESLEKLAWLDKRSETNVLKASNSMDVMVRLKAGGRVQIRL